MNELLILIIAVLFFFLDGINKNHLEVKIESLQRELDKYKKKTIRR